MENFNKLIDAFGEEERQVKDFEFAFGKHKGKTFEYVYNNDLSYVKYLMENVNKKENNALVKYFTERIEEDFCDDSVISYAIEKGLPLSRIVDNEGCHNEPEVYQIVECMRSKYIKQGYDPDLLILGKVDKIEDCEKIPERQPKLKRQNAKSKKHTITFK